MVQYSSWFGFCCGTVGDVFQGESKCRKPLQFGQQFHCMFMSQKVTVIRIDVLESFHVASLTTITSRDNSFLQLVKIHINFLVIISIHLNTLSRL